MAERSIPLVDLRKGLAMLPPGASAPGSEVRDRRLRPLRDLRISVTDRCNFRCAYCMPREQFEGHQFLPRPDVLSFEEITRSARLLTRIGVRKLRLTGGEPLLRRNLESLIEQLATLRTAEGEPVDLTLTTNASLLERKAAALHAAGLQRLTISLDALDDTLFRRMNDADFPVADVLRGIEAAQRAGLSRIKVNMVVQRGVNDSQILPLARHFRGTGIELRFIEFMDVGHTNGWRMDQVLPTEELISRLAAEHPLEALPAETEGETAQRWRYTDGAGQIGTISSVTRAFCGGCNRIRLSTDGKLYLCLFAHQGYDLRGPLREARDDDSIVQSLAALWAGRDDRYSELRGGLLPATSDQPSSHASRIEMSYIGG